MSFESGGDLDNPFEDTDDDTESETDDSDEKASSPDPDMSDTTPTTDTTDTSTDSTQAHASDGSTADPQSQAVDETEAGGSSGVDYITDLDTSRRQSTERLARALMKPEYHVDNPPVPYATWRDGTSTGRGRTTLELNPDVDALVRDAQAEFEDRYGTNITKADLREFAMVYGLANLDDVFAMAEEWGIQYDN